MKVSWDSQYGEVRMPGICAVTGQPATGTMPVTFRKQWTMFVPRGFARLIINSVNRPQLLQIPVCDAVRKSTNRYRLLTFSGLGFMVLMWIIAVAVKGMGGSLVALVGLVVGVAAGIYFAGKINVLKTDVDGSRLTMGAASDAFAQQFVALNPPGRIQLEGTPAPQQFQQPQAPYQSYPQPQYQQPQYQQPQYQQPQQVQYQQPPAPQQPYPANPQQSYGQQQQYDGRQS